MTTGAKLLKMKKWEWSWWISILFASNLAEKWAWYSYYYCR